MSPTLLILAAGMGSRYGGLKQIDSFGPNGETLMDYAIYDALAAGFTKVVFVIRRDFAADFLEQVGSKYENRVAVEYAFQELARLPAGFTARPDRSKPWGTTHAIWCARPCIHEPFVSVNADDYYGKSAFKSVAQFLAQPAGTGALPEYCVVGYPVLQTLSQHGAVTRAICELDEHGYVKALVERKQLETFATTGRYWDEAGREVILRGDEVVSMNMLGFTPAVFEQLERHLIAFMEQQKRVPDNSESIIPVVMNQILKEGAARMRVLPSRDHWFGVTHPEDKPATMQAIVEMVNRHDYPSPIWNSEPLAPAQSGTGPR
jgi:NDP-sugar pyrophosphorylase family protein